MFALCSSAQYLPFAILFECEVYALSSPPKKLCSIHVLYILLEIPQCNASMHYILFYIDQITVTPARDDT